MKRTAFVMVNHNGGEEVLESARSLLADLADEDLLILVDNGSEDGSGERVLEKLPRVHFITHPENRTFAEATNIGIRAAMEKGATYIGLINPDVRILRGMTRTLRQKLELRQGTTDYAVSPLMLYDTPRNRIWYAGGRIHWLFGWMSHRGWGCSLERAHRYTGATEYLTGCCWLTHRDVWQKVGLLDESYGMYAEDADWSVRAIRKGIELHVVPTAILVHRLSQSSGGGRNPFKMTYRTLATRLFFERYTPVWLKPVQKQVTWIIQQAYSLFLLQRNGEESMKAYRQACRKSLEERIPWPPSRPIETN